MDARTKFAEAAQLIDAERSMTKSMWGQFWSAHQRFFKYLCISSKVRHAVKIAKLALKNGKVSVSPSQNVLDYHLILSYKTVNWIIVKLVGSLRYL